MRTAQRNLTHLIIFNCVRDGMMIRNLVSSLKLYIVFQEKNSLYLGA